MRNNDKLLVIHLVLGAVMATAGLLGADRVLAEWLRETGYEDVGLLLQGTMFLDTVSGKDFSKFLIGLVLTGAGLALIGVMKTRPLGRDTLFVGVAHLLGTTVPGVLKNAFGRLRPFELLQAGDWSHAWFVGGNAFPSGHAGFYFSLFLPLAWLFPRWWWAWLIVPWFIAVARIDANDHFLSDVGVSIAIVAGLCLLLRRIASARD